MTKPTPAAIEQYILATLEAVHAHVRALHQLLTQAAPHATETIKWGNPFLLSLDLFSLFPPKKTIVVLHHQLLQRLRLDRS